MLEHNVLDLDGTHGASPVKGTSHDNQQLKSLRDFCVSWSRAVKTICLYPSSNPLPEEFRGKAHESLSAHLRDYGRFAMEIHDTRLAFAGETIYESTAGEENLAYIFFRDGIRELAFEPGVSKVECDTFLRIVADGMGATDRSVDVANRLWESALPHIRHYTVDRVIEGAYIEAAHDEELEIPHERFTADTLAVEPKPESPYSGLQGQRHLHILDVFGEVSGLSQQEKDEIDAQGRPESDEAAEKLGLEIVAEIIRTSESPRLLEDAVTVLEQQFIQMASTDRWAMARDIVLEVRGAFNEATPRLEQRLNLSLVKMADKKHFERLTIYLNGHPNADLTPIRDLFSLFGKIAITPITAMLGATEHKSARMLVCDFLIDHGRETVDLIGGFIYDKRWYVARNVAHILGELGNERGLTFLKKSAGHADARVRLETLRAAGRMPGPEADRILKTFLEDDDINLRRRALRLLGQRHCTSIAQDLKAMIRPDTLADEDEQEMRELLTAYARVGKQDAVRTLSSLANRSPLFQKTRWQPVRLAAIRALGASTEPSAIRVLEELTKDKSRDVVDTATRALSVQHKHTEDPEPMEATGFSEEEE